MTRWLQFFSGAFGPAAWWQGPSEFALPYIAAELPLKVLLFVAHPDDESECAGTLYRITHELGGMVDQVVVTNGAGGQHFTAPGLDYYGLPRNEGVCKELAALRRKEVLRAGRILGIRHHYFFDQKDAGFTLDPLEGFSSWDLKRVSHDLRRLLDREHYDLVITLLPAGDTHGHHKTAALLALEVVSQLPADMRPAVAAVRTGSSLNGKPLEFQELAGFPRSQTTSATPVWSFDRRTPLAGNAALDHSIIAHWVIAEHKSQGLFQMEYGKHTYEHFWQFTTGLERWESLWQRFPAFTLAEAA